MPAKKKIPTKKNENKEIELSREAPAERKITSTDIVSQFMAQKQIEVLTARTPEHAIKTRPGGNGRELKYVPHGYVTDTLNKAFGFDWDYVLLPYFDGNVYHLETVQTAINQKTKEPIYTRYIAVYGELTVRIHNPKNLKEVIATVKKPGPGSSVWYPVNELGDAIKAAKSDGLKVAAHELGIALDLYWDDIAEQEQYISKQETKKRADEEIIDSLSDSDERPLNIANLIGMAQAQFGYTVADLNKILGDGFMGKWNDEQWDEVVKYNDLKG